MALPDAIDRYTDTLRSLTEEAAANFRSGREERQRLLGAGASEDGQRVMAEVAGRLAGQEEERLGSLADTAERYLAASDDLERELAEIQRDAAEVQRDAAAEVQRDAGERIAALMGGHWVAATALTLAAESSLAVTPQAGIESLRRVLMMPQLGPLEALDQRGAVGSPSEDLLNRFESEVQEVELGLRGEYPVRGGAADPVDDAVRHITWGLAKGANSIAASAAAGSVLGPLLSQAASSFAHGVFGQLAGGFTGFRRVREVALKIIKRAVKLVREFIGDKPVDQVEGWIRDHVVGLLENLELRLVRKALQVNDLEQRCKAMLDALPGPSATRRVG
jgi:hypothetical protein